MANFIPLKQYMFYCLDKFIAQYGLAPPFLDIGCGIGDLSRYLASKGWRGKAVDFSQLAVDKTSENLVPFPQVSIEKKSLFEEKGHFKTVFLWDVIEHIERDELALEKVASLLVPNGYLLVSFPSNPKEWRWDDEFYGHYRRYTAEEMKAKLIHAGLEPVVFWDFTYPLFWVMRRVYTRLKRDSGNRETEKDMKTKVSSTVNAWHIPIFSGLLNRLSFLWVLPYKVQFSCFRHRLENGHEMFALARKPELPQGDQVAGCPRS